MDIFRDQIWQFIGVILTVIAIIVSILFFRAQRKKKSISYRVITESEFASIRKELQGKVQILYDGNPIQNAYVISIRIINDGDLPISASHFERPLTLSFGKDVSVLSLDLSGVTPKTLNPELKIIDNKIVLTPLLINSKDNFDIMVVLSKPPEEIQVNSRIEGIKEVKMSQQSSLLRYLKYAMMFLIISVLGIVINIISYNASLLDTIDVFSSIAVIIGVIGGSIAFYQSIQLEKRQK